MNYKEFKKLKNGNFEEFSKKYMFFAFDNEALEKGKEQLNVESNKDLIHLGAGCYMKKDDLDKYKALNSDYVQTLHDKMLSSEMFAVDAFLYELANHEYIITYDETDTLNALSLTADQVIENDNLITALAIAKNKYLENIKGVGW